MVASQRGSGRVRRASMRMSSTRRAGRDPATHLRELVGDEAIEVDVLVHRDRSVLRAPSVRGLRAHGGAHRLETSVEAGRGRPVGDVDDLGHLGDRQVEVVVEDEHDALVDVQPVQLASEPVTVRDTDRRVRRPRRSRVGRHVQLDEGPAPVRLGDLVAGAHREPAEPGVPGVRITERANMAPGQQERILDRILGAIRVAQDEVGDAEQPRMRCPHELGVGIDVTAHRPLDQLPLHGRHRFGAKHISALYALKSPPLA